MVKPNKARSLFASVSDLRHLIIAVHRSYIEQAPLLIGAGSMALSLLDRKFVLIGCPEAGHAPAVP